MNRPHRAARLAAGLVALAGLAACGGVQIKPQPDLPDALVASVPARVGVVVPGDMRNYVHKETRWGIGWQAELGAGHTRWAEKLFGTAFREARLFASLDEARAASGLQAIFEPRIEQFSFTTARETGRHYAVTIRYRIALYAPDGAQVDAFTLTGYGNSLGGGASSTRPLDEATRGAMRDAAAKFLVQFPDQPVAKQIANGERLVAQAEGSKDGAEDIETVPIEPESESPPSPSG